CIPRIFVARIDSFPITRSRIWLTDAGVVVSATAAGAVAGGAAGGFCCGACAAKARPPHKKLRTRTNAEMLYFKLRIPFHSSFSQASRPIERQYEPLRLNPPVVHHAVPL